MEITYRKRPIGIAVLAIVYVGLAATTLVVAFLAPKALREVFEELRRCLEQVGVQRLSLSSPLGVLVRGIVVSGVLMAIAYGFWRVCPWAWWIAVTLQGLNILDALTGNTPLFYVSIPGGLNTFANLALHTGILLYLLRQKELFLSPPQQEVEVISP